MARSAFAKSINALTYAAVHKHTQLRRQWLNSIDLYIEQQRTLSIYENTSEKSVDGNETEEGKEDSEQEEEDDEPEEDDDEKEEEDDEHEADDGLDQDHADLPNADYTLDTRQPFAIWAWHNLHEGVLLASVTAEFGDSIIPSRGHYPKRITQVKLAALLESLPAQSEALQDERDRGRNSRI